MSNDIITLELRSLAANQAQRLGPAANEALAHGFRTALDRLLALLRDLVSTVEHLTPDDLVPRIDECRALLQADTDPRAVASASGQCFDVCQTILAQLETQQVERRRELTSLVDMVRETMSTISGEAEGFHVGLGTSVQRFEALAQIDDPRRLRIQLAREVAGIKEVLHERQKAWDTTIGTFSARVAALEEQLVSTKREALLDPLTRISNRGSFDRTCAEWTTTVRQPFVLAMIDIDNFKEINDARGHAAGDAALVEVARMLNSSVRANHDMVARFGGDEFALLSPGLTLSQALQRIGTIVTKLGSTPVDLPDGPAFSITVSCGLAEFSAGDTAASLLQRADQALYEAKRSGKNRIVARAKAHIRELRLI